MSALEVEHYLNRAQDFLEGMTYLKPDTDDGEGLEQSSALLAIHSAISFSDALRVGRGSGSLSSDNHERAVEALGAALGPNSDRSGLERFKRLLSKKGRVAYGTQHLGRQDINRIVLEAQRFSSWVLRIGKELKVEGWRNASD